MSDPHLSTSIFGEEGAHASGVEHVRRRRRHRGPFGCLVVLLALALVAGGALYAAGQLRPLVTALRSGPADYSASETSSQKASVTIASGQTASQVGAAMAKAGIVKSSEAFVEAANANAKWSALQPGTYELPKKSTAEAAVAWVVDPAHKITQLVTVREGLRKWEVYELLAQKTRHRVAEYEAAEKDTAALGLPAAAKGDIEGWLFPSSYEFSAKTPPAQQLKAMVAKAVEVTRQAGIPDDRLEHTMIVASIVEAEGKLDADRPKIARVVENRLAAPMRLQMDSTVVYPVRKRVLATTDEDRALQNGYNTYVHDGLPKGPISNPGLASIKAAANPAQGSWLYFVAVNPVTGETKFATTWSEHEKNVKQWQDFCAANPGSC